MLRVWAIAINTFREAVRDKVLSGVLAFASFVLLFTLALAELSAHEQRRVVLDLGLASISMFSVVIAIFLGASLLYKEIEKKTLYVILPKPIHRHEFLLGKYLGIAVTAAVFIAIMGAIQLWVTAIEAGASGVLLIALPIGALATLGIAARRARDRTSIVLPWALATLAAAAAVCATTDVELFGIVSALLLTFGEVLVLGAVALFFSSFSTPFLTGVLSFGIWLTGRWADQLAAMRWRALGEPVNALLRALAHVVPNFHLFVPGQHVLTGEVPIEGGIPLYLATTMGYALLYAALTLVAAALIFRRRDFV